MDVFWWGLTYLSVGGLVVGLADADQDCADVWTFLGMCAAWLPMCLYVVGQMVATPKKGVDA